MFYPGFYVKTIIFIAIFYLNYFVIIDKTIGRTGNRRIWSFILINLLIIIAGLFLSTVISNLDGTAEGLLNSMKDRNIALSVELPVVTNPKSTVKMNDYAAISNEKLGERGYLSFAGMHPDFEDYKGELRRIKSLGFKGIKLHPAYQNCNMEIGRAHV